MIIRSNRIVEDQTLEEKDGKLILTNYVNLDPYLKANYEDRKDSKNGFSDDKNLRHVMRVPPTVWKSWSDEFPEINANDDSEAKDRALKTLINREENKIFSTVANVGGIF